MNSVIAKIDFENKSVDSIYNQNVRDQLILGLSSDDLRRRLLVEKALIRLKIWRLTLKWRILLKLQALRSRSCSLRPKPRDRSQNKGRVSFYNSRPEERELQSNFKKPGRLKNNCYKLKKIRVKSIILQYESCPFRFSFFCGTIETPHLWRRWTVLFLKCLWRQSLTLVSVASREFGRSARLTTGVVKIMLQAIFFKSKRLFSVLLYSRNAWSVPWHEGSLRLLSIIYWYTLRRKQNTMRSYMVCW